MAVRCVSFTSDIFVLDVSECLLRSLSYMLTSCCPCVLLLLGYVERGGRRCAGFAPEAQGTAEYSSCTLPYNPPACRPCVNLPWFACCLLSLCAGFPLKAQGTAGNSKYPSCTLPCMHTLFVLLLPLCAGLSPEAQGTAGGQAERACGAVQQGGAINICCYLWGALVGQYSKVGQHVANFCLKAYSYVLRQS